MITRAAAREQRVVGKREAQWRQFAAIAGNDHGYDSGSARACRARVGIAVLRTDSRVISGGTIARSDFCRLH